MYFEQGKSDEALKFRWLFVVLGCIQELLFFIMYMIFYKKITSLQAREMDNFSCTAMGNTYTLGKV